MPASDDLQAQCERGQQQLMRTEYLQAEETLAAAEALAWERKDFDTLARVYMPLQEARRQRRQCCGEGTVCLDLLARNPADPLSGRQIIEKFPHGQLLVAGWESLEPARTVRRLAREHRMYVETFLAAVYAVGDGRVVAIAPTQDVAMPAAMPGAEPRSIDDLIRHLPAHCIVLDAQELPAGSTPGTPATFGTVMGMWERLHAPFLAAADATVDPVQRIAAYRLTQRVDYGCELAHQKASATARELARQQKRGA
jgi:hypothetical protein